MGQYRFHIQNDVSYVEDNEGVDLPDLEAMRDYATKAIGDLIAEELRQGRSDINLVVMVDDAKGERVASFRSTTRLVASESPFAR